ncbi:MAG: tetratricopeptide repeat protein, partial [Micromonosporaceae bacterium]
MSLFADTDDWSGTATAQSALGLVMRRKRRYAEGVALYDSAIALFLRLGDRKSHTAMLDGRADLVAQMGDPRSAFPDAAEAVRRAAQTQDPFLLHRAQRTLGRVYTGLGRYDEALESLRDSVTGFEAMGRPLSLAATLRDLALLFRRQRRRDDARRTLLAERDCLRGAGVVDLSEVDQLLAELD